MNKNYLLYIIQTQYYFEVATDCLQMYSLGIYTMVQWAMVTFDVSGVIYAHKIPVDREI